MENASNALIMAGGILIGVLILTLAVYLFVDLGTTASEINGQTEQQRIVEFNSKFTSYENYKDNSGNWNISIYDIITLASFANENNRYYGLTSDDGIYYIDVKIGNRSILTKTETELIQTYLNSDGSLIKFKCTKIEYQTNGRVKLINLDKVT